MEIQFDRFILDDSADRVDEEVAVAFLLREVDWERWRTRDDIRAQVKGAWRVVAAYERESGVMVGFGRAVSDGVAFAYLDDVFVLPDARGVGLGAELVRMMIDEGPGSRFRWALDTDDAHDMYRRFGFQEPGPAMMDRPSRR